MKRILVCTDGSTYSEITCEYAAWLARRRDAEVEALYVTDLRQYELPLVADISGSIGAQPYQNFLSQLQELEQSKAEVIEASTRKTFELAGYTGKLTFHHHSGMLVDHVEDIQERFDLVVLGKRGMSAESAIEHLGSSMERVVRACDKPCLVTPRAFQPIQHVVLAYDGSPSTRRALECLAKKESFGDLELHVVSVEEKGNPAIARVDEAVASMKAAGLEARGTVLKGDVEDAIAAHLESLPAPMLVIGAYGHSRIRRLLLGSTTTDLLRTRNVPVLCIR